ncbi:MAG: Cysteine-tRNA ligase [Berkelbacteria bacterium GW2011_GWA1_36_9]|uniref:Cysteine--tRNA ligase n=1 Tax=Berkelbacteria bacterium GW2011_GWA1_36_9 TaxID=1618331 RepID=A0A0G0IQ43_9BACT|nr:MAG: Cysteine-tRNA ligase [Berkelbacteria bacterium GW2011_GWA1_36_9]
MLKIYNSLNHKKEEFKPLQDKKVGIYVCGPTVYAPSHLGHARTWIFFDWLRRYLIYKDYKVKFVQNITDVGHLVGDTEEGEDKIEKIAKVEGKTPSEIAKTYEKAYFKNLEELNILKPSDSPRATENISEIIDYLEVLLKNGYAYEVSGNVYFNVSKFAQYGKLSSRKTEKALQETRVKKDTLKKNQEDFALWLKAEKEHLQKWPSPWGEGYPGWHIECSVMAEKNLGQPFDIHGGGTDNIFPHHENEIAQSWGYAQKPLANYFLHSGMLFVNHKKMSKSLGNFITISNALEQWDADTIKLAFMMTHWQKPFDWGKSAISEAKKIKERLVRAKMEAQDVKTGFPTEIEEVLDNDFNAPQALALVLTQLSKLSKHDFEILEEIFGLELISVIHLTPKQKEMIKEREIAREKGDFKKADDIRKTLEKKGIILEDTAIGTRVLTE